MSQNLITFEKALKENYLPAWRNQLGIEPSALLGKIKKPKLTSNKIVASAPIGLSGGFGYGAEGAATPEAGGVRVERFETEAKDMYVNVVISEKLLSLQVLPVLWLTHLTPKLRAHTQQLSGT